jgi:ectoine hydroxylase-related dioxygenase (phytanoyl-CoA dioxygenase family)
MRIDADSVAAYHRDGYLLVEDLFSPEEVAVMLEAASGGRVAETAWNAPDANGEAARLALWMDIADDVWGAASTCPRIVNSVRILQGEDVSFFHGKVMLKQPGSGGAFEWHQDYGYWYDQGFVFPRMMSAWVALDPSLRENGCLEVLRGSHKLGRLNHTAAGSQTGADPKRLEQVRGQFEHVHCEMRPGSVLFFDNLLLHGSAPNRSARPRRSFIICYNATANPCIAHNPHLDKRPCPVGSDDGILKAARASSAV